MKLSFLSNSGIMISGMCSPVFMPSVRTPFIADIAAVSGLTKYTPASRVPLRPLKFLLKVLRDIAPDFGDCPMPMQGPQAFSITLAPEFIMSRRAPFSAILARILLEPGDITKLTSSFTFFPLSMAATFMRSVYDEFVQLPIAT